MLPTVIEPLREEWAHAQAAALTLASENKHDAAVKTLRQFHHRLCTLRVLDPACGSGNFLYVTLEHLKRLEGEVLNALDELGFRQTGLALGGERADAAAGETVDPHNLLGIELNPRAAEIAEVVLWIGYLQWHFRTRGDVKPPQPVIRDFRNIECRDAVLAYDAVQEVLDEAGTPVTRWDGKTMKTSPVTGDQIPDERARVPLERYVNPRKAAWPQADFIVGNPPFIGNKRMRTALGDGYVEALRGTWRDVPESADLVMYWWQHAAQLTRSGLLERFGLITTNSIRQAFNRRVIETFLSDKKTPISLVFAIPDHPWVDTTDGADVRIAMTVASHRNADAVLRLVTHETQANDGESMVLLMEKRGRMHADLKVGPDVAAAPQLRANAGISSRGVIPFGEGMVVSEQEARTLGIASRIGLPDRVRPYLNGRDITGTRRGAFVLDMYGLGEKDVMRDFPEVYQRLLERVKPARANDKRKSYRDNWWIFAEPRPMLRRALVDATRFIVTPQTAKHRFFTFLSAEVLPDDKLIAIAVDDARLLGVLSSCIHGVWALASGGRLGVGNDPVYNKSTCFECFPFPVANDKPSELVRTLAESLDAHRKRQQAAHPKLTLTGMYNVLEKLRSGEALTPKERTIHEQGLVSVLRQMHDELDAAVLAAYGWSDLLPLLRIAHGNDAPPALAATDDAAAGSKPTEQASDAQAERLKAAREEAQRQFDEAVLERLVALNTERAAEEARGLVRWLRPEFQNPQGQSAEQRPEQGELVDSEAVPAVAAARIKPQPWPKAAIDQVRAVADTLAASPVALSIDELASRFRGRGPWKRRLPPLLEMLVALGKAQSQGDRFAANR